LIARRFLTATPLFLASTAALADVPYLTDDPGLIARGHHEVALGFDRTAQPGPELTSVSLGADFGVTDHTQLGVGVLTSATGRFTIGEVSFRTKLALVSQREGRAGIVFAPSVALPLDDTIRSKVGVALPVYAGIAAGPWSFYGGVGAMLAAPADGGDHLFGGVVASREIGDRWSVGAELDGRAANRFAPGRLELGTGVAWALDERFTLAGAVYRTISHREANGDGRAFVTLRYDH
jgi:hypothetical protein